MLIPIPQDSKEVLTFDHTEPHAFAGTVEPRLTLKVAVTRRNGKPDSISIQRIGDGMRSHAWIEVTESELSFLASIFAFYFSEPEGDHTPPML